MDSWYNIERRGQRDKNSNQKQVKMTMHPRDIGWAELEWSHMNKQKLEYVHTMLEYASQPLDPLHSTSPSSTRIYKLGENLTSLHSIRQMHDLS